MAVSSKRGKRPLLASSIVLASIIFSCLLAEIVLRLIGFSFFLYPTKLQFGWPNPKAMKEQYRYDNDLFWVTNNYTEKLERMKADSPDIVYMGCSVTEFGRYDRFFKQILDREFPGNKVTFMNVAVGGWSSYQGLRQLKRDIIEVHPKIISIFYGWNDHWISFGIQDKDIAEINRSIVSSQSNLRIVQLINKLRARYIQVKSEQEYPERVSVEDFRNNLLEMVQLARANKIIPVLLTAPSSHMRGKEPAYLRERWLRKLDDLIPLHNKYVSVVRGVAEEHDVVLVDLAGEFDRLPMNLRMEYLMDDGVHLTMEGNRNAAELIFDAFEKNGLLTSIVADSLRIEQ